MSAATIAIHAAHAQEDEKLVKQLRDKDARTARRAVDADGLDADAVDRLVAQKIVRRHGEKLWLDEAAMQAQSEAQVRAAWIIGATLLILLSVAASVVALLR